MIPRHQKVAFWILLSVSIAMAVILIRLRERAHDRMVAAADKMPLTAPAVTPVTIASLVVANDAGSSLDTEELKIALPEAPGARARLLLEKLLEGYARPHSMHPIAVAKSIPNGASSGELVEEVFLMPIKRNVSMGRPGANNKSPSKPGAESTGSENRGNLAGDGTGAGAGNGTGAVETGSEMAVVNLSAAFAAAHPSGIEPELLTLLSMIGTLHANLPRIAEVRFLVDGQPRETLAGHADLTRVYLATDSVESRP